MLIISLRYIAPVEQVDLHLDAHVAWLKAGMADGWLLVAGRKIPREGGILIAKGDRATVEALAATDPFVINGVAQFDLIEFAPSMVAPGLEALKP